MANRETIIELVQQQLKKEFAKRYKMNPAKSLFETRQKEKVQMRNHSVLDHLSRRKDELREPGRQNESGQTLKQMYLSHHQAEACLCGSCNCGRHLCRLGIAKPDLTKRTTYQKSYESKQPKQHKNQQIVLNKQSEPLKGSYLDIGTEYTKTYHKKSQAVERPHPEDNLKFQGPAQELTTYGQFYRGHRGQNQYIKPANRLKRGQYPLIAKSTYSTQFVAKSKPWDFQSRQPDQLRTGCDCQQFREFNPEDRVVGRRKKNVEKYEKTPSFGGHFETNYNKEFVEKIGTVCPSKIMLQSGLSQQFTGSKNLFQENSDFKAMSPQFHAIATSKHFYA